MRLLTLAICFVIIFCIISVVENDGCIDCCEAKTLFCRSTKISSLRDILNMIKGSFCQNGTIERLVADGNNITLSDDDVEILKKNFSKLKYLDLRSNKIKILPELESDHLIEMQLGKNEISDIYLNLDKLPNLTILNLKENKLKNFTKNLGKLKALILAGNKQLSSINFSSNSLEILLVGDTNLKDIKWQTLVQLPKLQGLNVRDLQMDSPIKYLDPKIFHEHESLQFLFTSARADCCNVKRMEKAKGKNKREWHCSFKNKTGDIKESCGIRLRSKTAEDTSIGRVEVNLHVDIGWQKLNSSRWTMQDAHVVCREIGFKRALEYIDKDDYKIRRDLRKGYNHELVFPEDTKNNNAFMWNKNCTGTEYSIHRCPSRSDIDYKYGTYGVGVRCQDLSKTMKKMCDTSLQPKIIDCDGKRREKQLYHLPWQDVNDTTTENISLSNNRIIWIQDTSLKLFQNLTELDLSNNGLSWLSDGVFQIDSLKVLDLKGNKLQEAVDITKRKMKNVRWFFGLKNLESLDISSNFLSELPEFVFQPLGNLLNLSMQRNSFSKFEPDNIFDPLRNLNYLDISGMRSLSQINRKWDRFMRNLVNLKHLKTNYFTDCCFVNAYKPDVDCIAPSDTIASCERMIKYAALRYLMWFLVVLTIGGNVFALLLRLVKDDCSRVQNLFICSLSFSDMLMGVYLIGIINKEIATEGEYYKHDYPWRTGTPCKVFGIISVISSEVSVFTLVYIAYDRFLHIAHAMEFRKIGYRTALFLLLVTWLGCSAIAIVPAVVKTYFVDDVQRVGFYGTNSICMPLQLPGQDTIAWEYCLTIFGILNFIGAAYLIIAYIQMFYSSYSSAKDSNNSSRLGAHTTMAKRFAAVVFTDVCCWVPIAMLLFLSLARAINDTGDTLYLWFSICVIPINSAINPILYTLSTPMFWQKVKDVIKRFIFSVSKSRTSGIDDEHVYDRAKKS